MRKGGFFDPEKMAKEIAVLETEMKNPDFWNDQKTAKGKSQKLAALKQQIETLENDERELKELEEFSELEGEISSGSDPAKRGLTLPEKIPLKSLKGELEGKLKALEKRIADRAFLRSFSGKYDDRNAILSVHAGVGGTEAQDWAAMLLRMYLKYCDSRHWPAKILEESRGQEAGLKSVTIEIMGQYAFGYLKSEAGVHRLVRISPFDAEKMRHTSFALVEVLPELENVPEITIKPEELRIDTFLAGGHGGQSVQTTYSAVRIVHLPTKIAVSCQEERSQAQNKEKALNILKTKLLQLEEQKHENEKQKIRGKVLMPEWSSQIRSYVLHPYKMVKDHRTKFETNDAEGVLEGNLDEFITVYLKWQRPQ
jgi:peptide chain release factor 2